jgi:RHS repeat-associated protein
MVSDTNALGFTRSYGYDAVGNQTTMTDRNGRKMAYIYDDLDRRTQERWLDSNGNSIRTTSYGYDAASQMLSVSDPDSSYAYTYDLDGRVTSVDNAGTAGVPNVLLGYGYDAVDNLLSVTDTIGGQQRGTEAFTYDALNRVTQVRQSGDGVAEKRVDLVYDAASQMTGVSRYADLAGTQLVASSEYGFDLAGRLTSLMHGRGAVALAAYGLTYDAANRVTRFSSPDGVSDYNYDERDQLLGSDHSYQSDENYSYDGNGNRVNTGYETGENNRLLSDGRYTYEYDAEGNRTKRVEVVSGEVTEYVWDYCNRLTAVTTKDGTGETTESVEYAYDAYDRRIEKSVDGVVERYVYDGDHIALVFDGQGSLTHRYLHGPQVDQVLAEELADGQVRWALTDHQGTVRDVVDSQGNVLNHISYDSFGNVTGESNPDVDFRFGYTGREFDEETGQYYYRARYYDAGVGQFISEDPIGFEAGDTNLYRYVGNGPTNYRDPYGEDLYSTLNGADQFLAGFADAVTFGASTKLREGLYGETATRNHSGALFSAGNVTGDIATTPLGGAALKGPKWAKRVAQAYNRIGDARDLLEQAQSAKDIASGCGDLGDVVTVAGGDSIQKRWKEKQCK